MHVDAAVERPLVGLDVRLDRLRRRTAAGRPARSECRPARSGDRLRLAVLEDLEVFLLQVADEVALLVGDQGVDLDVVDLDLEGRRLLAAAAGGWPGRRLPGSRRPCRLQSDDQADDA